MAYISKNGEIFPSSPSFFSNTKIACFIKDKSVTKNLGLEKAMTGFSFQNLMKVTSEHTNAGI